MANYENIPEYSDDDFTDEELDALYGTHMSGIISCEDDAVERSIELTGAYGS